MQKNTHSFRLHLTGALIISVLMSGCASTGTTVEQSLSTIQTPAQWKNANNRSNDSLSTADSKWWEVFHEQRLNQLVELALEKNNTLAAAGYKLYQAQLNADLARTDAYPTVSGSAGASSSRSLDSSNASSTRSFSTSLSASYTVDLWVKSRKPPVSNNGRLKQANRIYSVPNCRSSHRSLNCIGNWPTSISKFALASKVSPMHAKHWI